MINQKSIPLSKPIIWKEEIAAVTAVMESWMIIQWPEVEKLEKSFCELTWCKYAVAMNSGTSVLHAALYGLNIWEWDEVICPPFTFVATANAILMSWAKPIFCDVDENDYTIDPKSVEWKITSKTKAILAVSLYWQTFKYNEIKQIADKYNLRIIEDAAQSIWALYNNIPSGWLGDAWTFSLYATKNIHCAEWGIMVTNNEECYIRAKMLRHHGQSKERYVYYDLWYNYRLSDIHAAIANVQVKRIDTVNNLRINNAKKYNIWLKNLKWVILPYQHETNKHVYHQYTIRITNECLISRDEFLRILEDNNIWYGIYYPIPLHLHHHFLNMWYKKWDFTVSETLSEEVVSLPVWPHITDEDIDFIIYIITQACWTKK